MSDTPRTDEQHNSVRFEGYEANVVTEIMANHARILERELATVKAERDALKAASYTRTKDCQACKWKRLECGCTLYVLPCQPKGET
jgi:hypothetical protein